MLDEIFKPEDWGLASKEEWVADRPLSGDAAMPALEGRDVVGFSESVDFAIKLAPDKPAGAQQWTDENGRPVRFNPATKSWYHIDQSAKKDLQKKLNTQDQEGSRPEPKGKEKAQPKPRQKEKPEQVAAPQQETPSASPKVQSPVAEEPSRETEVQRKNVKRAEKEIKKDTSVESYRQSEVFNAPTTRSNEEFVNNPPHEVVKGKRFVDIKKRLEETGLFPEGINAPPKYIDLLSQLGMTKAKGVDGPPLSDFIQGAGAGAPMSQAGELMMMLSSSMSDKQADAFFNVLGEIGDDQSVVNKDWVTAARRNRAALQRAITNNLGGGQVVAASWDVKNEVEALGLNYDKKGFSTDAFFRVKRPDGSEVIFEASLKKDKGVFFINGGAASLATEAIKAMPSNSPVKQQYDALEGKLQELKDKYNKGANFTKTYPRVPKKGSEQQIAEIQNAIEEYGRLEKAKSKLLKEHTSAFNTDVYMDGLVDNVYQPAAKELLQDQGQLSALISVAKDGNVNLNKYVKALGANSLEEALQKIADTGPEQSTENHKKLLAKVFEVVKKKGSNSDVLNKYSEELTGRYEKYKRGLSEELAKEGPLRTAVISNIRKEFPLKAVLTGEEVMCIGDVNFDLKTAERMFGTTDIDEINQKLKVVIDKKNNPVLVYSAGQEGEELPIALIQARQKGIGYASMGFEASLHPTFYDRAQKAVIMENMDGKERSPYRAADKKAGADPTDPKYIPSGMTFSDPKKPSFEDYMEILKAKRASVASGGGANYADSMVFYKGKVLGRCPAGTTRAGKTCIPGASATPKGAGYKQTDLGGLSQAQVQALSKAKSTEDIIKAHKKQDKQ